MASETVLEHRLSELAPQGSVDAPQQARPMEELQIEEDQNDRRDDGITYPSGPKLCFGQIYTLFPVKGIFLAGLTIFEIGSLVCTVAPTSKVFILGRAISGVGRGAINGGMFKLLRHSFPLSQQGLMSSIVGAVQSAGLVSAPLIGGALVDAFSWRACFGMNIPLGILCIALTAYGVHDPVVNQHEALTLMEKIKKIDVLGTVLVVPAITSLLMALQWGGLKYGWGSWRIIVLFVFCLVLFAAFGYLQYRQGENAIVPARIWKQRSILAGMWYAACCEGVLGVTEYYMSIYFQGVLGYTATKSGLLAIPMVGGLAVTLVASGIGITLFGYYYPPIASGLLTTLDLEEHIGKAVGLLAFLGAAVGLGIQGPQIALQTVMSIDDVSSGGAVLNFGAGMGSSLWICASATLFQGRLQDEIQASSPGTNVTALTDAGISGLREYIGPARLGSVLAGYENAVIQTLYIPLGLALLSFIGSLAIEKKSIKKKQS
ncbi:hypothetical protein G7Z17_g1532 [Cylindrodendrum hubeiense]|uniref:Major facilitator superfamily (MFS) profile domain-containing protein n=1 Tax=Cylindrodendrum hubeiense TaxID=595255 RepID=A0A9P5LF92_9HYPO|nr:hypothetical protein G7Z17_g1532 [Cylindrodendrum hubeiense]